MRILFLDLDGTVRHSSDPSGFINRPDQVIVYPEAAEQIKKFVLAGWKIAYVSNQGDIAAGYTTHLLFWEGVTKTNAQLIKAGVSRHFMPLAKLCPHSVDAGCFCRKPRPGLVAQVLASFYVDPPVDITKCLFVGDLPEDEGCADACGMSFMAAEEWRSGGAEYLLS